LASVGLVLTFRVDSTLLGSKGMKRPRAQCKDR